MAEVSKTAILGASGFIGNRLIEMAAAEGRLDAIVPVVRRASGLALAGRFGLQGRVVSTLDRTGLASALGGCSDLVCAAAGDPRTIVESITPIYEAARQAGLRRIIYLSSAMVHGQAPAPATSEASPLSLKQPLAYNKAKITAERLLQDLLADGGPEIVILRPGIVYGPRSRWTGGLANDLLSKTAFLADAGTGICNAVYVDNLVHAVNLARLAKGVSGEAFLLNDRETIQWRDLVAPLAEALGIELEALPRPAAQDLLRSMGGLYQRVLLPAARGAVGLLPKRLAEAQRAARRALRGLNIDDDRGPSQSAEAVREMALLQSCRTRLSSAKAERMLGYDPPIRFAEACRRCVEWLRFADYPVR